MGDQIIDRRSLEQQALDASIALRELESIAVEARERGCVLTDEHAAGLERVRVQLRLVQLELQRARRPPR